MSGTRPRGAGDNHGHSARGSPTLPLRGAERREGGFSDAVGAPEPPAERGRGRRRLAVVVPAVAVVCGLVVGGLAGARVVGRRPSAATKGAAAAWAGPKGTAGPVDQLEGAGVLLFTDPQGRAHAQAADGRDHRVLGQLGELANRPPPSGLNVDEAGAWLAAPPDGRAAELGPDADQVYLRTTDGAAAVGRLADGSVRRLVPAGWRSPMAPRHSADGKVLGVCGYRLGGDPLPAVTEATSWVLDGWGAKLASLPGCLYDVAADGGSALVADPPRGGWPGRCRAASSCGGSRWAAPTSSPGACGCGGAAAASGPCSASTTWSGCSGPCSPGPTRAAW
ncbi:MAG TPA: hypothetical protein VK713_10665 [Actinomycetes bacterium]|nr:hypothetical protein [Actinomycetes bacterium]